MKSQIFSSVLLKWYHQHKRDLPWRRTKDPYKIWISEIMLQQTTVNTVIAYYDRWIKEFPAVKDVAQAKADKLLKMWQGLGYYNRVRNIQKAAQMIVLEFKGRLPDQAEQLRKLPGFGPYTTGAVLSIAFDKRFPIVDASVRRVFMRILAIQKLISPKVDQEIYQYLDQILPLKQVGDFNQGLMELGALICRPKEPLCSICPVKDFCQAYKQGIQEIIPLVKKKSVKEMKAVSGIIKKGNKFFIQQRPSKGLLADLWEFPGGKVESKETLEQALVREIKEELNTEVMNFKKMGQVVHFYTEFKVNLNVFNIEITSDPKTELKHRWVTMKDLSKYAMPSGSAKIVEMLTGD
mgnify:CR=1 FL=1